MTPQWPPSPCVEDEDVALAKEHVHGVPLHELKSDDQPASSRGSVDQYPIILDSHAPATTFENASPADLDQDRNSDKAPLPQREEAATIPAITNHEKRFVYLPSKRPDMGPADRAESLQRSRSATRFAEQQLRRGRPPIPRLQTDLGDALDGVVTGHRRAVSPYAHRSSTATNTLSAGAQNGHKLLSPMDAHEYRRPVSAHPKTHYMRHDGIDSDHKLKPSRRAERSRSRSERQSFSQSDRSDSERYKPLTSSARQHDSENAFNRRARRQRSPAPPHGAFDGYSYTGQDHITPPQSPKVVSTWSSVVDQTILSETPPDRRCGAERGTNESPYTSSAEEAYGQSFVSGDDRTAARRGRSRRGSRSHHEHDDKARPTRGISTRQERVYDKDASHGPRSSEAHLHRRSQTPGIPKGLEDYFAKAFATNQNRRMNHADSQSRAVSPKTSPPQSPPRTPLGERSSRDYFEAASTTLKPTRQRSRPPSWDDSHFKDIKPLTSLLGAATLGASLAAKTIPSLSRASTSHSGETPSTGSQSRLGSGQRSRKSSPVSGAAPMMSPNMSRTNSTAGQDDAPSMRTTTYTVHENRTLPLSATYAPMATLEPPRPSLRAASYSHTHSPDQPRPPALYRAHSSTPSPSSQGFRPTIQVPSHPVASSAPITPEVASLGHSQLRPTSMPPCPRSRPVTGLNDWYTIRDLPYLDFCPTCMSFLGVTRFRDHFVPSLPKDPRRPVVCAMSLPWLRVAWVQSIKHDRKELTLVWKISTPPPQETRPCPGSKADLRRWYHLTDPRTGRPVESFDICSACVRNLDLIFPKLQYHLFDRPATKPCQEKVCNMNTNSRHFFPIMIELERLADRREKEQLRQKDIQDFVDFVRRISRHRECTKDTMLATSSWHYIPELPELTICEECFEEVVWPFRDRPIARDVSKTLRLVPNLHRSQLASGNSCQLYSDRMRKIFYEAVNKNDFDSLKTAAKYRYSMEHRLQEMQKLYEMDQKAGIDRRTEMERNVAIWKSIE
ncbi:hypothetical protein A1O1_08953 [Capronia coronata CBS 617.96]|uniref:Uncharacterized protein n=1 Tax=Capronia coronata CBS 617.96 TaxID=1182541 RepID=W9XDK5_9EURO|nr:uncharacterized protein A1O1_08953 [Capronia coronata CBS 617.96]EXJ78552.1 hypothetical protein A1O1_08953 [Capronia coronata CBS 617.96]